MKRLTRVPFVNGLRGEEEDVRHCTSQSNKMTMDGWGNGWFADVFSLLSQDLVSAFHTWASSTDFSEL
jgi:hypothetical protein